MDAVTEGPDHRSSPGARVMLIEQGGLLPKEFRGVMGDKGRTHARDDDN